ncbi:MAG: hypothetical protein OES57_05565 [Acidimicrobiia bacterium]|nr:hypothetical protein [Acidimicrobiia bacterium]
MTAADPIDGLPRPAWFVASFALYVTLGLLFKSAVLNWIVGPLWLLLTLWLVPTLARRARDLVGGS